MTWIRCSDRMPMGEACEVVYDRLGIHDYEYFSAANVETLRRSFGDFEDWIDRTEWRPLDEAPLHDEGEPATWHDETRGVDDEPMKNAVAWNGSEWVTCSEEEAKRMAEDVARAEAAHGGKLGITLTPLGEAVPVEGPNGLGKDIRLDTGVSYWQAFADRYQAVMAAAMESSPSEEETLRAALEAYGFEPQLSMLTEECGELVAAVNRYRRGRDGAFEAMIEEMADVSILLDQMRLVYGAEIDAARARKLARLAERLGK